jgi:Leucine-rich repeat (LRR) protein/formylglycine-generating enzyme required for sulfatase activity
MRLDDPMTQRMRTVGIAMCVAAMVTLFASYAAAQTGKLDDDLQRAQEILNQLTAGSDQASRQLLQAELARIEAQEYVVPVKLTARKYTAGSGYFPVTASKSGMLEPPVVGRLEMPRGPARRAKSQLNRAYAAVRVGVISGSSPRAIRYVDTLYVRVDDQVWYVSTDDVRLGRPPGLRPPVKPPLMEDAQPAQPDAGVDARTLLGVRSRDETASRSPLFWERLTTVGNKYGCMVVLPDGSLLAGTDGAGVVRSHDRGVIWTASDDGLPTGAYVAKLAVCGGSIFAGTWRPPNVTISHDEGVFRSKDGGLSWASTNDGLPVDRQVSAFAYGGAWTYVSLAQGMYRSEDDGDSWTACDQGLPAHQRVDTIISNGSVLLAGVGNVGVHRSYDRGESWALIPGSPIFTRRFVAAGTALYAACWEGRGVSRSSDDGNTWQHDTRGLTHRFIRDLVEHQGVLYAASSEGGRGVFISHDGGESWDPAVDGMLPVFQATSPTMSVDSLAVSYPYIYAGTAGGVFRAPLLSRHETLGTIPDGDGAEALAVHIPDPNLEGALREALGLPEGNLTRELLASLEELHADGMDIERLSGLEFAVNLTTLNLNHNHTIVDLGPVAGLTRLEHLGFAHNQVTDLGPVANLTSLIRLTMDGNPVASFDPLVGIKSLTGIHANLTLVSDLSPLAHLPNLGFLALCECQISDLTPLTSLTLLGALHLRGNQIVDVSPLAGLSNLSHLDVSNNQIVDIAPLMGLPGPRGLVLGNNPLGERTLREHIPALLQRGVAVEGADLSTATAPPEDAVHIPDTYLERVLRGALGNPSGRLTREDMESLTELNAQDQRIWDLEGLQYCTGLTSLELSENAFTDISPLSELHQLRKLRLWGTGGAGFSLAPLSGLNGLVELHVLQPTVDAIERLDVLSNLTHLETLSLSPVPGSLATLANMDRLQSLVITLTGEEPTDLTPLGKLPALRDIQIVIGNDTDVGPLAASQSLREVAVTYWNDATSVPNFGAIRRLRNLHLHRFWVEPPNALSADLSALSDTTNITHLWLQDRNIDNVEFAREYERLVVLQLSGNQISDLSPLVHNPLLGEGCTVDLSGNPLSAVAMTVQVPELLRRGVKVTGIDLQGLPATASVASATAGMPQELSAVSTESPPSIAVVSNAPVAERPSAGDAVPATALIVGISAYDHHPNLVNPTFDAQAVGKELREVFGCDTTTLLDATKVEFLAALRGLAEREYADDEQLLVFFSGHGYFDDVTRRGYLTFRDTKPIEDDPYYQSFVSHEDVRVLLERLDCNHVLLVVDSCFSGTLDPMVAMAPGARAFDTGYGLIPREEYIRRKLQYRTRRYITAGGKEYVSDGRPGQHSPFARQFLAALRTFGGSDGILTLEEILLHLERVDPQPRTGELFGNEPGSSFILVAQPPDSSVPTGSIQPIEKKTGSLQVHVMPRDAVVEIRSEAGALRTLRVGRKIEAAGVLRYLLPVGRYVVHATKDGYEPQQQDVTVNEGVQDVQVRLSRQNTPAVPVVPMPPVPAPGADRLIQELSEQNLSDERRRSIGAQLAAVGDPRRGTSVRNGVPDIDWVSISPGGGVEIEGATMAVAPFYIARYPVTYGQYEAFVKAEDGFDNPAWWRGMAAEYCPPRRAISAQNYRVRNAPRVNVSWYQAVAFTRWLSARLRASNASLFAGGARVNGVSWEARLPTEWEWQWAAQGGSANREYPWGSWQAGRANTLVASLKTTTSVGVYPQGATASGVMDMCGNVWEWCLNERDHPYGTNVDTTAAKADRGGSFDHYRSDGASSFRDESAPELAWHNFGFRVGLFLTTP